MATDTPRRYRAACPHCGAPVEFASAASASAVCSYCQSTLLREGDALRRIGQSAELFDDHSPLQLGAAGRWQGSAFTLLGRLQYRYDGGTWNEWHALFDSGKSGWLSEDNGRYVLAFDAPLEGPAPAEADLAAGQRALVNGLAWEVASVTRARLLAAQGELPQAPRPAEADFTVADLRNTADEVGTLDYGAGTTPGWAVGHSVRLAELALTGLREGSEKALGSRGITCPNCGAAVAIRLASTQAVVCGQCQAAINLPEGDAGAISHFRQEQVPQPWIPLGKAGRLALGGGAALPWQVVGWVRRQALDEGGGDDGAWQEYLLYNPEEGFAFLVDAEDGWSWVLPLTGAPDVRGNQARHGGRSYQEQYTYRARVTHVLGEFYWRLERGQEAEVTDYASGPHRLSREATAGEVTWSGGQALLASQVAQAFGLQETPARADVAPVSGRSPSGLLTVVVVVAVVLLVMLLMARCSSNDCDSVRNTFGPNSIEYQQCKTSSRGGFRSGGGSFGGFSSGGGHK